MKLFLLQLKANICNYCEVYFYSLSNSGMRIYMSVVKSHNLLLPSVPPVWKPSDAFDRWDYLFISVTKVAYYGFMDEHWPPLPHGHCLRLCFATWTTGTVVDLRPLRFQQLHRHVKHHFCLALGFITLLLSAPPPPKLMTTWCCMVEVVRN